MTQLNSMHRTLRWMGWTLLLALGGTTALADSSPLFTRLRTGMTETEVHQVLGRSDSGLILSWDSGRLTGATMDFDPAQNPSQWLGQEKRYESLGPSQPPGDVMPMDWVLGEPESGQKWKISLQGNITSWYLVRPWKAKAKKKDYRSIYQELLAAHSNTKIVRQSKGATKGAKR